MSIRSDTDTPQLLVEIIPATVLILSMVFMQFLSPWLLQLLFPRGEL
jgi:hypothetical protein